MPEKLREAAEIVLMIILLVVNYIINLSYLPVSYKPFRSRSSVYKWELKPESSTLSLPTTL